MYTVYSQKYIVIYTLLVENAFTIKKMNQDICDIYIGEKQFCPFRMKYKGNGLFISMGSGNEFVFYLTNNH